MTGHQNALNLGSRNCNEKPRPLLDVLSFNFKVKMWRKSLAFHPGYLLLTPSKALALKAGPPVSETLLNSEWQVYPKLDFITMISTTSGPTGSLSAY